MSTNVTIIVFSMALMAVVLFFVLVSFFILNRQKNNIFNDRLRNLGIVSINNFNEEDSSQTLAMQRVLRARLSEIKKLEKGGFRSKVNNLLLRSGSNFNFQRYIINSCIIYVISIFVFFSLFSNFFLSLIISIIPGFFAQNMYLSFKVGRRQKQFTADFAGALDIIVRGVTVGLSINESMKTVAYEAQGPVSEEFKRIVDGQAMGIDFDVVLEEAIHRMPTPEFRFFSIVMQIQRQTGGSMAKTLADLSSLLRGRKEMRDKITALSSEAKSSATIIGILPVFITGLLWALSPEFLNPLFNTTVGNFMIGGAIALMLVGVVIMKSMINFKI